MGIRVDMLYVHGAMDHFSLATRLHHPMHEIWVSIDGAWLLNILLVAPRIKLFRRSREATAHHDGQDLILQILAKVKEANHSCKFLAKHIEQD